MPNRLTIIAPPSLLERMATFENRHLTHPRVRRVVKVLLDYACGAVAVILAILLDAGPAAARASGTVALAAVTGALLASAQAAGGSYRTVWRYTSLREVAALGTSIVAVTIVLAVAAAAALVAVSGVALLLISLLMLVSCCAVRALRRWQETAGKRRRRAVGRGRSGAHRILLAGAGARGLSIGRELRDEGSEGTELVGYLDDDPSKLGAELNGARVLGPLSDALALCERHRITEVIVAMPSANPSIVHRLVRQLEDVGIRTRVVGGVRRFVEGSEVHRPGAAKLRDLLTGATPHDRSDGNGASRPVLVTGGAGYIGSHLVRMLLERGYHVRVLDRFDYGRAGIAGLQHPHLEIVQGDICSTRDVSRAVRNVDAVIALAAIVGDPACNLDPEETINLNYSATKILVETCNFYGVRRIVFASSCSVYGANGCDLLTEGSRLHPVSLYARTRVLSENILFDRHGDVEPVVLRLATVFGVSPRMRFDLFVNTLTARAVVERRITLFGGNQWRPNVHCRDAARAFILALEASGSDVAGQVFNVGGDAQNHRISHVGQMVAELVGDVAVETRDDVPDPRDYRVSFERIRRVLGFVPKFSVADGIREVAAAVRGDPSLQRYQDPLYHNVQALKEVFVTPRRRRDDFAPARIVARA
ncbi:MAG TPA: NAD-dependent epimerase/dehydratase family protein [Gemmatimonadales bacterium]|nr:NAD-dependent epimerase/dehydratase family protein [Gemmatimonadales bacterium]